MFNPAGGTVGSGSKGGGSVARHALDFRVLTRSRVALLDASKSLFRRAPQLLRQEEVHSRAQAQDATVGFRPIPGLSRAIVDDFAAGRGRGTVAGVELGVICGVVDVVVVGEALWVAIARGSGLVVEQVVVKMKEC